MTSTADFRAAQRRASRTNPGLALAVAMLAAGPAAASSERAELLELKNTIVNLVDALVAQKVLSAEQAAALKRAYPRIGRNCSLAG